MGLLILSFIGTAALVLTINFLLFRKSGNPLNKVGYWIVSILAIPVLYAGVIYLWYLSNASFEKKEFDKEAWNNDPHSRYVYVEDLINSHMLIGLDTTEVKSILGSAENLDDSTFTYYMGYSPEVFLNGAPEWLEIKHKDGKVNNVIYTK